MASCYFYNAAAVNVLGWNPDMVTLSISPGGVQALVYLLTHFSALMGGLDDSGREIVPNLSQQSLCLQK